MNATATDTKPPYGGFRTFWNFIDQMHQHLPLPQILDRSVMGQRGGSARSELYTSLRFFSLIDDEKRPTDILKALTEDPSVGQLKQLVEHNYQPVIALNLDTATPRQVDEALMALGSTPATVARARTFFLNAAEESGIEVGRLLKTARAPSTPRRRSKPKPKPEDEKPPPADERRRNAKLPVVVGALVDKLPAEDDGWTEEAARQWLALVTGAIAYDYGLDASKLTPGGTP
jgi:hypothetical protein